MKPWQKSNYIPPPEEKSEEIEEVSEVSEVPVEKVIIQAEGQFVCPNCGKVFDTEKGLITHLSRWCKG